MENNIINLSEVETIMKNFAESKEENNMNNNVNINVNTNATATETINTTENEEVTTMTENKTIETETTETTEVVETVETDKATETTPKKRGRKPRTEAVQAEEALNRRFANTIWASYDAKKVARTLDGIDEPARKAWFETMGISIENCTSMEAALKISGLDFTVEKKPIYYSSVRVNEDGKKLPPKFSMINDSFATVRSDNGLSLGIVSKDYEILQNQEAFDFLDSMAGMGAKFETAGFFKRNGAGNYITMSTEPMKILGDDFMPYIMIVNSHDGKGSIRITFTPTRVVCKNSMVYALKHSNNIITIQHSKKMYDRLVAAKEVLLANSNYMEQLNKIAEELAVKPFSEEAFKKFIEMQYPIKAEDSEIIQIRNLAQIEHFMKAYKQNDLDNFDGTAWRAVQAIADAESHPLVMRKTKTGDAGTPAFQNVVTAGMPLLQLMFQCVNEAV